MYIVKNIKIGGIPRPQHLDIGKYTLLEELIEKWTQDGVILGIEKTVDGFKIYEHGILNALIEYELVKEKIN
ncbi:MAG: hypothetical protein J6A25_02820 [Lachnospiraceae bacterium]|nr:hypothetical protein [Lachnospiraceae bacterium]